LLSILSLGFLVLKITRAVDVGNQSSYPSRSTVIKSGQGEAATDSVFAASRTLIHNINHFADLIDYDAVPTAFEVKDDIFSTSIGSW
jgi:hypothetical protein